MSFVSAQIPHLAIPFQLNGDGTAQTVPQDSIDDITQCVEVLCATPAGSRAELPSYGIPDQTFAQTVSSAPIAAAIGAWEPRAAANVTVTPGDPAGVNVTVALKSATS